MSLQNGSTIKDRSTGRDNNFNLIRLLAAFCVIASHVFQTVGYAGGIDPLAFHLNGLSLGAVAVMVFFAISGFYVTQSFANNPSVSKFLMARSLRIFPALAVALGATILFGAMITTAPVVDFWTGAAVYFGSNMTLYSAVPTLPGVFVGNPNGPAANISLWTLEYEVYCYLWVAVCGGFGFFRRPFLLALSLLVVLLPYAAEIAAGIELPLFRYAFAFAVGQVFWMERHRIVLRPAYAVGLLALTAALYFTPLFLPAFTVTVAYCSFVIGFARLPVVAGFNRLGDYSYGVYIFGFPIQQALVHFGVLSPLWNVALAIPLALACAVVSWHWVEKPAIGLKSRIAGHRMGAISGA